MREIYNYMKLYLVLCTKILTKEIFIAAAIRNYTKNKKILNEYGGSPRIVEYIKGIKKNNQRRRTRRSNKLKNIQKQ